MSSDLLFYILPREGKLPVEPVDHSVQSVDKDAFLRQLNDEEKELNNEEKEAREQQNNKKRKRKKQDEEDDNSPHGVYTDEDGIEHFDDFA